MSEGDLSGFFEAEEPELAPVEIKVTIDPYDFIEAGDGGDDGAKILRKWCQQQIDTACTQVLKETSVSIGHIKADGDLELEIHCWDTAVERGSFVSILDAYVQEIHDGYLSAKDEGATHDLSAESKEARAALHRLADCLERQSATIRAALV